MIRILVSACLLGERVRHHGGHAACEHPVLVRWQREGRLIPFCPEVAGGLPTPRLAAEVVGGDGPAVLTGAARVLDVSRQDVTERFLSGARAGLGVAAANDVRLAILKDGSPSCGSTFVHDGTFSGVHRKGQGVTAALLSGAGIRVFGELEIEAAAACLAALEASPS